MFGTRVLCQDEEQVVWSVPIEWTDRVEPRLETVINAGRAPVLVEHLLALSAALGALAAHAGETHVSTK